MALRIHFTGADVGRVRIASGPDPLWEIVLSLHVLQHRDGGPVFGWWRRHALASLREPSPYGALRLLRRLAPPRGYFPDFLTPAEGSQGLDRGLRAVRATPTEQVRRELALFADRHGNAAPVRALAGGDPAALSQLVAALRWYFDVTLAPHWEPVRAAVDADRAVRLHALGRGGVAGLFETMRPVMRWEPPVLVVDYPVAQDLPLAGRGLLLVPSYFCWQTPVTLADPMLPPVLVYPVPHEPAPERAGRADRSRALAALLGGTRAAVLAAIATDPVTTGELARRTGIAAPTASEHASVLRAAGLITSQRRGSAVLHAVTPLGLALLGRADPPEIRPKLAPALDITPPTGLN